VEEEFADCLATTYAKHVTPFLSLPKEHWPEVEMLWAYSRNGICRLFFNDKSMPVPVQRYRAVGIGGSFAEHFLNKFWKPVDTKTLEILAAYTVFAAKRAVPFCGKSTQIVTLHQSHPADLIFRMPSKTLEHLEDEFRSKWVSAERDTIWKLLTQSASRMSE
jgi:hypothetical protein